MPLVTKHVGYSAPLVVLIAAVVMFILAQYIAGFAREFPSAGGLFTYVAQGAGPVPGFLAGWLAFAGYVSFGPGNVALIGATSQDLLSRVGFDVPWIVPAVAFSATVFLLSYFGIGPSLKVGLITGAFEVVVVTCAAVTVIAHVGMSGFSIRPLTVSPDLGPGALALGLAFSLTLFIGFDASVTLGEEAREPRKTVPWAVLTTVVVVGLYCFFGSYAAVLGFGVDHGEELANDSLPWTTLGTRYIADWYGTLLDVAGLTAILAVMIGSNNLAARVLYAMGRAKILPPALGRSHPKYQTPYLALVAAEVLYLAIAIPFGLISGPFVFFGYAWFLATLLIVAVYILVLVAAMFFFAATSHSRLGVAWHRVLPILVAVALTLPIAGSVFPFPSSPYNYLVFAAAAWLLLGLGIAAFLHKRRPREMSKASTLVSTLEEEVPLQPSYVEWL